MLAKLELTLIDKKNFKGKVEGTPLDIAAMIHKMCNGSENDPLKSAVLLSACAILSDLGYEALKVAVREISYNLIKD